MTYFRFLCVVCLLISQGDLYSDGYKFDVKAKVNIYPNKVIHFAYDLKNFSRTRDSVFNESSESSELPDYDTTDELVNEPPEEPVSDLSKSAKPTKSAKPSQSADTTKSKKRDEDISSEMVNRPATEKVGLDTTDKSLKPTKSAKPVENDYTNDMERKPAKSAKGTKSAKPKDRTELDETEESAKPKKKKKKHHSSLRNKPFNLHLWGSAHKQREGHANVNIKV